MNTVVAVFVGFATAEGRAVHLMFVSRAGIIDFVEKFDDKCVRKVFFVLCTLIASPATPTGGSSGKAAPSSQASSATSDSSIERDRSFDEFHILVR